MLTLADMAMLATLTPYNQAVIYAMLPHSQLFDKLPFTDVGDINTMIMEATGLPVPSHRPINPTAINIATAKFGQRPESLKIITDKITVDRQLLGNKSSHVDPRTAAIEQYTKAIGYEVVNQYINGNPIINPDQPAGLAYRFRTDLRLSNGTAAPATQKQVIDANDSSRDLTVEANALDFLDDIHALMSLIDGGNPDVLLTNRQGWLAIGRAVRRAKMFAMTKDSFGRSVLQFGDNGPLVVDTGYTPAGAFDRSVQVLPNGTTDDLVTDAIYAVKFGESMSGGLQKKAPESIEFAENSADFPYVVSSYEWVYGFQLTNPFSVAVLRRAF